jgi:hypothetical protein
MAYERGQIRTDRGLFLDKGNQVFDVRHPDFGEGGAKGDGVTSPAPALTDVLALVSTNGGGRVFFPHTEVFKFPSSSMVCPAAFSLYAPGSVIRDLQLYQQASTEGFEVWGGKYQASDDMTGLDTPFSVYATNGLIFAVRVKGSTWGSGTVLQADSRKIRLLGYEFDSRSIVDGDYGGAETLVIMGQQHVAMGIVGEGTDDGVVIKAATAGAVTNGVVVTGAAIKNHSGVFDVGTEVIGGVRNLVMTNGVGLGTAHGVYLKVGKLAGYEASLLENFRIADLTQDERIGGRFIRLIHVVTQRESTIRDGIIQGISGRARAHPSNTSAAIFVQADNTTVANGGRSVIERMHIADVRCYDDLEGEIFDNVCSTGTGGAITTGTKALTKSGGDAFTASDVDRVIQIPGAGAAAATLVTTIAAFVNANAVTLTDAASTTVAGQTVKWGSHAIDHGIYCEEVQASGAGDYGIIRQVEFRNVYINGCEQDGVYHNCPTANEIVYDGIAVENWGRSSALRYGFHLVAGKVKARNWRIEAGPLGGDPIRLETGTTLIAQQHSIRLGSIAAGAATAEYRWVVPERCYVYQALLVSRTAVVADAVDYLTIAVGKAGASNFISRTTAVTGFSAETPTSLVATYPTGAVPFFARDGVLTVTISQAGAGKALNDAELIVRYMEH